MEFVDHHLRTKWEGHKVSMDIVEFEDRILVQLKYDDMMDTTYTVNFAGGALGARTDDLIAYPTTLVMGNQQNMKIPIIATQVAKYFDTVLNKPQRSLVFTTSGLFFNDQDTDFEKLMCVLGMMEELKK